MLTKNNTMIHDTMETSFNEVVKSEIYFQDARYLTLTINRIAKLLLESYYCLINIFTNFKCQNI